MRHPGEKDQEVKQNIKAGDIIGVIFDFNGTCIFDSGKHLAAWQLYVEEITGKRPDAGEIDRYIRDHSAKQILEHYLGYEISPETEFQLSEEKEGIYRRLCREDRSFALAPGLPKFLDYLAEYNIPRTIATSTSLSNITFYFEALNLYEWFDPEKLSVRDGKIKDKPAPDLYLAASRLINKPPERCLAFEDSLSGIAAARAAGVRHVVCVRGDNKNIPVAALSGLEQVIEDFTELK